EVRILILRSSYDDLIKKGNKYPFRPGMTASVEVLTSRKENVLSVPLASVTTRNPDEKPDLGGGPGGGGGNNNNNNNNRAEDPNKKAPVKKNDKVVVFVNENGKAKM